MVQSYSAVKQKKVTECVPNSERIVQAKNGRKMMKCTCAECGITKTRSVKGNGVSPQKQGAIYSIDAIVGNATDLFVEHALPWMGKKAVEMGRYYGSEALRNNDLQKKAINYGLKKLTSVIQNVGSRALDQLSTKIRPKKNYKTNRKDSDGAGLIDDLLKGGIF